MLPMMWVTKTAMPTARSKLAADAVDGIIYAVGGTDGSAIVSINESYDPFTDTWSTKASMPETRDSHAAAVIGDILHIVGGARSATAVYDPTTDSWTNKANIPTARRYLAAGAINGILYAVGGLNAGNVNEAYDPETDTWTTKSPMTVERYGLGAGVIDGILYAVSGYVTDATEAYDPDTDTWTTKAPIPRPRHYFGCGVVKKVLFAVGSADGAVDAYDSSENTWYTVDSMLTDRYWLAVCTVDSAIYAIGGYDGSSPHDSNEAYQVLQNIVFRDPTDDSYYTDDKGSVLKLLDFGTLIAGQTSVVKEIVLQNGLSHPITGVQVSKLQDISDPDKLEISKTNNPFVAEEVLSFGGPYNPGEDIGSFYVRVVAHEDGEGRKPFKLQVKAKFA